MRTPARAFSLVEAVAGLVLVAVLLVAVMETLGASRVAQYRTSGRRQGLLLGEELLSEILQQRYQEPGAASPPLGRDSGEGATSRLGFDDVDDYDGWFSTPPQAMDGTPMAQLPGWSRAVSVAWVNPADPGAMLSTESGAKLITVTVRHNEAQMARLTAIRARALPDVEP